MARTGRRHNLIYAIAATRNVNRYTHRYPLYRYINRRAVFPTKTGQQRGLRNNSFVSRYTRPQQPSVYTFYDLDLGPINWKDFYTLPG